MSSEPSREQTALQTTQDVIWQGNSRPEAKQGADGMQYLRHTKSTKNKPSVFHPFLLHQNLIVKAIELGVSYFFSSASFLSRTPALTLSKHARCHWITIQTSGGLRLQDYDAWYRRSMLLDARWYAISDWCWRMNDVQWCRIGLRVWWFRRWLDCIVEGVETAEQIQFLKAHGCDQIQGYFFSPPLPTNEFEKMLIDGKCL